MLSDFYGDVVRILPN
jgi:hypothetical protein